MDPRFCCVYLACALELESTITKVFFGHGKQTAPTCGLGRKAPRQVLENSTRPSLIIRAFAELVQCLTVHSTERPRSFQYSIQYR
jgi:hypothetical protein